MTLSVLPAPVFAEAALPRAVVVICDPAADKLITDAADRVAASDAVLVRVLRGAHAVRRMTSAELLAGPHEVRVPHHLIAIGLPNDPVITAIWQREARIEDDRLYAFGFGALAGPIGYVEADRNPFLHSLDVARTPYAAQAITLTGTTPAGVAAAVDAFLTHGLVSGVIGLPGWKRTDTTLLDRDPLAAGSGPAWAPPAKIAAWERIAVVQASADEYQGVLADGGVMPLEIWRWKYHRPGAWDEPGMYWAIRQYLDGLHRRAYGSTWWTATFADSAAAAKALPGLAKAAALAPQKSWFQGQVGEVPMGKLGPQPGYDLTLWQDGARIHLCNLPRRDAGLPTAVQEQ